MIEDNESDWTSEKTEIAVGHKALIYVKAVVVLAGLTLLSTLSIYFFGPEEGKIAIIATVVAITSQPSLAFTAMAVRELYLAQNSRLTELLNLTAESSEAKGKLSRTGRYNRTNRSEGFS